MSGVETEAKPVPVTEATVEPVHQQHHDSHDEEYESADDAYEEVEVEEEVEEEEDEEEERSPSQEQEEKELDDDEDVKNPQFIPKRGYFYEHDDRTKAEEENEVVEEPKKEEKKPPVKEPTKWSHDMYNEDEQTPKSKDELSKAYGYDIFTEEQAPRARRRRRYGRGPNKYTRQWEDEEAYQKPRGGGFRGRGSRGRGNFRGTNRPAGDENHVEEEFPALPGSETTSKPPTSSQSSQPSKPAFNKENQHQPSQRRGSGENASRPQHQQENRRRNNDYDSERSYGPRGDGERNYGRGGGGPSRGRGRRNEFSNRNRYPNRRDGEEESGNDHQQQERSSYNQNQNTTSERERPANRPRPSPASLQQRGTAGPDNKDGFSRPRGGGPTQPQHSNSQPNGHVRDSRPSSKDSPLPSKPPFTNTEYTGSHSLTANRGATSNRSHQVQGGRHHEEQQQQQGRKPPQDPQGHSNVLAEKGVTDLRDVINARRQQQQHQPGQPSDQRMPPRLQQQSQPQHQHQQQQFHHQQQHHQQQQHHAQAVPIHHQHHQEQPPRQHQMQQLMEQPAQASGKPKRFSAQRQRPDQQQQSIPTTSVGGGNQTSAPMGHLPSNMMPVVSEQMVPSPVPGYPQQAPPYYEGPQGYETSGGSPVTVATGANGTSVSPSMWTPHAYASNAPYPSPPTGPQVPQQAAFADHAAFIAAQQAGPPIYAAPPPFIQDPGMLNYNTGAPPFAPTYHPQAGYQGFPQVTPAPPPELYHAGVTYYNPQPQHRPMMMAPKPRTKLQLVEPPEKNKGDRAGPHLKDLIHNQQLEQHSQSPPLAASSYAQDTASNVHGYVETYELAEHFSGVSLAEPESQLPTVEPTVLLEQMRKPSPLPDPGESWSAQMEETNDAPEEDRFEPNEEVISTSTEVIRPPSGQRNIEPTSSPSPISTEPVSVEEPLKEQPHSPKPPSTPTPPPQTEETKKDGEE